MFALNDSLVIVIYTALCRLPNIVNVILIFSCLSKLSHILYSLHGSGSTKLNNWKNGQQLFEYNYLSAFTALVRMKWGQTWNIRVCMSMTENIRSFSRKYTMILPTINGSLDSGLQTSDFCNEPKDWTFYELRAFWF